MHKADDSTSWTMPIRRLARCKSRSAAKFVFLLLAALLLLAATEVLQYSPSGAEVKAIERHSVALRLLGYPEGSVVGERKVGDVGGFGLPSSAEAASRSKLMAGRSVDSTGSLSSYGGVTSKVTSRENAVDGELQYARKQVASKSPRAWSKTRLIYQGLVQRFPRIMIIGFGKAGTRALFDVLKMHPHVLGPRTEKRFFSDHYEKGLRSYLASMPEPGPGCVVAEKSPDYIIDDPVPGRIVSSMKRLGIRAEQVKFVIVLRDPIDRAMSEYLEWQISRRASRHEKLPPFHTMALRQNHTVNTDQPFLRTSNYARFIKRWLHYFNRTQTCFVDGDKFVKDPFSEVHLLESCLELRPFFTPAHFVYESKRGFYCFKASINQTEPYCMNSSKGRKHPVIPERVLTALNKHYQQFDSELQSLTGRAMQWQLHS